MVAYDRGALEASNAVRRASLLSLGMRCMTPTDWLTFLETAPKLWQEALTPQLIREAVTAAEARAAHGRASMVALEETKANLSLVTDDALSPELARLALHEIDGRQPKPSGRLFAPRSLEDGLGPWGVVCSLTRDCPVCGVPLSPHEDTVVFRCGHSFHAACVMEEACPQCFLENCTLLG